MRGRGQRTGQEASQKPELESTQPSGSEEGRHFPTREEGLRPCPYCLQVWGMGFWCCHSPTVWFQHPTESLVTIGNLDGPQPTRDAGAHSSGPLSVPVGPTRTACPGPMYSAPARSLKLPQRSGPGPCPALCGSRAHRSLHPPPWGRSWSQAPQGR